MTELRAETTYSRIDSFLAERIELTRSAVQRLIKEGGILMNGKPCKVGDKVATGDIITIDLPETKPSETKPEDIPIDIVYQDADIAVVNKPQGMVVHPAAGNESGTLVNALLYHIHDLSGIGGEARPGIVHRIDKMTSGLLVVAKNDFAHEQLSLQFHDHTANRSYIALVHGNLKEDEGTVDAPIGRHPIDRKRMAVREDGRRAITHWSVLYRFGNVTLLQLRLETGRTHQIRVHMAYIKHPVLGDEVYGSAAKGLVGQALHGYKLCLAHPRTGEKLTFTAPIPAYFKEALKRLGCDKPRFEFKGEVIE